MENNLAIRSEICLHTIKWVKLENGTLRKRNYTQKITCCVVPFI
jgi:hypothetical protein